MVDRQTSENTQRRKRVAIVGAGPAGLVTAKTLLGAGADVVIYETGSAVGGTWLGADHNGRNFIYKNLHINTSKRLTAFEGLPFPKDTQVVPDHRDMARYMQAYAERFGLIDKVRFENPVARLSPTGATPGWTVTARDGSTETFDAAVVCTGPFNRAHHSADLAAFAGDYVHSADYRVPGPYAGKRVCIVGAGNSAADIGSDICRTAERVVMVARSPVFVTPHLVWGLSFNDISRWLQKPFVPWRLRRAIVRGLVRIIHGKMTDCGFLPMTRKVHATISSTIVQDILFNRVEVKRGITSIDGTDITFEDGERAEFDMLVAATGFVTEFPFLSQSLVPTDGRLRLYNRIVPPEAPPGLYFVGMVNLDTPINFACEQQAKWIAGIELGNHALPSPEAMRMAIERKARWVAEQYGSTDRHSLQEESVIYYRELNKTLRDAVKRGLRARSSAFAAPKAETTGPSDVTKRASSAI